MPNFFLEEKFERFSYMSLLKISLFFVLMTLVFPLFLFVWTYAYDLDMPKNIIYLVVIVLAQTSFSIGLGTYMASILIEQFVFNEIKKLDSYKQLRIAIKFFHGPVSHVLIYAGIVLYLFSFCFFEKFDTRNIYEMILFAFLGFIMGLIIGFAQKFNLTWRYQYFAFLIYLLIMIVFVIFQVINIYNQFVLLVFFTLIGANIYLINKNLLMKIRGYENLYSEKNWRI